MKSSTPSKSRGRIRDFDRQSSPKPGGAVMPRAPPGVLMPPEIEDVTHYHIELRWGKYRDHRGSVVDDLQIKGKASKSDIAIRKPAIEYILQTDDAKKGWIDLYKGAGRKYIYDNLKGNTQYTFRVKASNQLGAGPWSDAITILTDVEPTTGFDVHRAIRFDDKNALKRMLEKDIPRILNVPNKLGQTPLTVACLREMYEIITLLVDYGADVDAVNDAGKTSLMLVAFTGNVRVANILYENGASLRIQDRSGCSVLHAAVDGGHPDMVDWAIRKGADIHLRDHGKGWTPLHRTAAISGNAQIARMLLKAGASIDDKDIDGKSALMIAACNNYASLVEELLKHGADPKQKSRFGKTALEMASALGKRSTTELLAGLEERDSLSSSSS